MSTNETKTRTITLTARPPVKIKEDEWPVIAHGSYNEYDNRYEFQANRTWNANLRVRRHADGRAIVYGVYDYSTRFQNERGACVKAGALLDKDSDLVVAIEEVGDTLKDKLREGDHEGFVAHVSAAVSDCIADLPAQEI